MPSSPAATRLSMASHCRRIGCVGTKSGSGAAAIRSRRPGARPVDPPGDGAPRYATVRRQHRLSWKAREQCRRCARCGRARIFSRARFSEARVRRGGDPRNDRLGSCAVDLAFPPVGRPHQPTGSPSRKNWGSSRSRGSSTMRTVPRSCSSSERRGRRLAEAGQTNTRRKADARHAGEPR